MANDVDPQVRKKIERLTARMLTKCTEKAVFEFLQPATRVSITITLSRGLSGLHKESSHRVGGLTSGLISELLPSDEVWEQIFQLKPFSERPDRDKDKELRRILLVVREHGSVDYYQAYHFHKPINEVLKNNDVPYRFVKMYIEDTHREGYVLRKIE